MKTVYVCSPYRGKTKQEETEHIAYAVTLLEYVLASGCAAPIVPHLYFPQVLDDSVEGDREIAMRCGKHFMEQCDLVVAGCRYGISDGMEEELAIAVERGIPIVWIDAEPQRIIGIFDRMIGPAETEEGTRVVR